MNTTIRPKNITEAFNLLAALPDVESQNKQASQSTLPDSCAVCESPLSIHAAEAYDGLCADCY